jgi:hypothetical protein
MNSWLAQLDKSLRTQIPDLPPAGNDQTRRAALMGQGFTELPAVLQEFFNWLPAGLVLDCTWELPHCPGGSMLEALEMAAVVEDWKRPSPPGTFNWWNPAWIALLDSGSEDFLCVDMQGSFGNPPGSVVQYLRDQPFRPTFFPDFEGWLRWLSTSLDQGMGKAFVQGQKLHIALGRKATQLYHELNPQYPLRNESEVLGTSPLDRCLNIYRKHGLRMGPKCMLPFGLNQGHVETALKQSFVRVEATDYDCLRIVLAVAPNWTVFLNVRVTPEALEVDSLVCLPETVADTVRLAVNLQSQGDHRAASSRLTEAAFLAHKKGFSAEAMAILMRALELQPDNQVAAQSRDALQSKKVVLDVNRLRPFLRHLVS